MARRRRRARAGTPRRDGGRPADVDLVVDGDLCRRPPRALRRRSRVPLSQFGAWRVIGPEALVGGPRRAAGRGSRRIALRDFTVNAIAEPPAAGRSDRRGTTWPRAAWDGRAGRLRRRPSGACGSPARRRARPGAGRGAHGRAAERTFAELRKVLTGPRWTASSPPSASGRPPRRSPRGGAEPLPPPRRATYSSAVVPGGHRLEAARHLGGALAEPSRRSSKSRWPADSELTRGLARCASAPCCTTSPSRQPSPASPRTAPLRLPRPRRARGAGRAILTGPRSASAAPPWHAITLLTETGGTGARLHRELLATEPVHGANAGPAIEAHLELAREVLPEALAFRTASREPLVRARAGARHQPGPGARRAADIAEARFAARWRTGRPSPTGRTGPGAVGRSRAPRSAR